MTRPFFFGEANHELFGVHSAPVERGALARAVVLCAPGPQEYMTTHWAYRRLAALLSKAGVHVLRFDYYGVGDSAGETDEGTLEIWERDICTAEKALRKLSGAERVSLIGYRLGALLAWRASQKAEVRPRDLVLWDPVIRGSTYLQELRDADRTFASRLLYFPPLESPPKDLGGYPLPQAQRVSIQAIDLVGEPLPSATRVHAYVGRETSETRALSARLTKDVKRFSYEYVPEEGIKGSGSLMSNRILHVISGALAAEGT